MQVCQNPKCKAKHYEISFICSNCNQDLPAPKTRKAHDVYCLTTDYNVTTKRITDKFLNDNNKNGIVELLVNYDTPVTYIQRYDGSWKKANF